ncbi:2-oxo acid dehydrogenase subunit E2 [Acetobacterium wieringae]|uniref:Dihydrolipoyllysine-residue acetyltransferase component of pyruvate dehydrogenase complex n=1 Tax=Acetobacterium wieringae TaxID=52694 RepID=A0A1F2PL89_9FIRM|nr:2-oxo acid dehydrogenase subunit E2 [Acetobacterium wieringae]OFV72200.1 dihydrolipoyllysine-residue acetyltransferase component of pyruvate dehydrogenase complex [Acetobacterium wieringae]
MMENEIILPKETLDMTIENSTNAETIKEATLEHDQKSEEALSEVNADNEETGQTDVVAGKKMVDQEAERCDDSQQEENLEEKLTAAIEELERNLEETIKEGIKQQPTVAIQGIINDEMIEDPQEVMTESDPRVGKVRATPAARRIAREFKVDIEKATGTGPNGRVEVDDVKKLVVIQPGTFDYKSKEPVVIGTSLDKIAGNPRNLFTTPGKLEEIPVNKTKSRKKLSEMNQKVERLPNPELDFVPFVDANDIGKEEKDTDVVTKISELDFVPFVDLKAEPLREEIIVKPTPMHLLRENEQEALGKKNKKSRGLSRKKQEPEKNTDSKSEKVELSISLETADSEIQDQSIAVDTQNPGSESAVVATEQSIASNEVLQAPAEQVSEVAKELPGEAEELVTNEISRAKNNRSHGVRSRIIRKYRIKCEEETAVISLTTEIDMTEIKDLRKKITKKIEEQAKYRCTYTDFLLLATSRALVKHPLLNARREDAIVVPQDYVNMGLTVESEEGLIVPVIKDTQTMSFVEIVKSRGDLLKAVKNKHLSYEQREGSTFTISNLGMYGIREFTAIINPTNSAILSVGEVVQRIRIFQGEPVVRSVMKISLNLDQRVANGVDGAKFLQAIKADMENPSLLLF